MAPAQSPAEPSARPPGRVRRWWLGRSVLAKVLAVLAAPLVALFGTTSASLILTHDERAEQAVSLKALNLVTIGNQVLADSVDAETGVLDYVATGDPLSLGPYNLALSRIGADRTAFNAAAGAQGVSRPHEVVDGAVGTVLAELAALKLDVSHGAAPGSLLTPLRQDKLDLDRLRGLISGLDKAPAAELVVRRNVTNGLEDAIGALDIAVLVLELVAVLAGIALFTSGVPRRVVVAASNAERLGQPEPLMPVAIAPVAEEESSPAADLSTPDSESTEPLPTRRAARPGANLWVLYIEDNPANVEVVARYLASRRHAHLASHPCGREGYEYAAANRPDIILLDLPLEDLDGAQTLDRLKADPATAGIPVVVLSADASPGLIERLFAAGALACLTKPLDLNEFGAILDSLPAPTDIGPVPFVPPQSKPPTASEIDKYLA